MIPPSLKLKVLNYIFKKVLSENQLFCASAFLSLKAKAWDK